MPTRGRMRRSGNATELIFPNFPKAAEGGACCLINTCAL
jgi:hypothetical protein